MAGRINDEDLNSLKQRLDIVEVVQPYTALKRSGSNFMGRCPFHDEKSPSFSVRQDKGFYHCFGCGVGGDAITFVQEADGLSFTEAVEKLARQFGITLRYEELRPGQAKALGRRTRILELTAAADTFYRQQLRSTTGDSARTYLTERGVEEEAWDIFGIGWAPDAWSALSDHLIAEGASPADVIQAGLATKGRRGPVDRFRARVLFPIRDQRGDTVAFGGRILPGGPVVTKMDGAAPKYINSPGTDIYDKSTTLYGLDLARREIVKRREVLVVEGYMDVIALNLAGMPNAVAPCGTALTEQHFTLLQRLDARVTLSLDADDAGFDAAERARERAEKVGVRDLGVLVLHDGQDPADLVSAGGVEAVRAALADRKTAVEFQIEHLLRGADLSTPEAKTQAYRSTFDLLGRITDPTLRYHYVFNVVGPRVGLPAQRIEDELNRAHPSGARDRSSERHNPPQAPTASPTRDTQMLLERQVLQVALQRPDLLPDDWGMVEEDVFVADVSRTLFRAITTHDGDLDLVLDAMPDDDLRSRVRGLAAAELTMSTHPSQVARLVDALRAKDARRRWQAARQELQDNAGLLDATRQADLLRDVAELERVWRAYERRDVHDRDVVM